MRKSILFFKPIHIMAIAGALAGLAGYSHPAAAMGGGGGMSMPSGSSSMDTHPMEPKKPTETRNYIKAVELINEGKYEDAIKKLEKVERDAPDDPDVLNYLGYANRKLGRNDESLSYYQRALKAEPSHLGANEYLGELCLQMEDLAKAEAQQAKLDKLCTYGCAELEALKTAIADYKAKHP